MELFYEKMLNVRTLVRVFTCFPLLLEVRVGKMGVGPSLLLEVGPTALSRQITRARTCPCKKSYSFFMFPKIMYKG